MDINSPKLNDNRNYDYTSCAEESRREYDLILSLVPSGSKVIDLGCGNGSLLKLLRDRNKADVCGIELSKSGVAASLQKGLSVQEGRIDEKLPFADKEFDFAICNVTIQMVMYPEILLTEMKRVASKLIISFPNFGFYRNRIDMFFYGRVPHPMMFGYSWYSTGHIHQLSIIDFLELVETVGNLHIEKQCFADETTGIKRQLQISFPNLFQILPVFLITSY